MSDTQRDHHGNGTGGAPVGNRNRLRHGLRAGRLPRGCGSIRKACDRLRRQLEDAVVYERGEVSLADAATIQTALRWERHAMLSQRWLRLEGDSLTPGDRLAFSREIARASAERDKCLRSLNLEPAAEPNPWAKLSLNASQAPRGTVDHEDEQDPADASPGVSASV